LQIERQREKDGNIFQDSRADNSDALSSLNAEQKLSNSHPQSPLLTSIKTTENPTSHPGDDEAIEEPWLAWNPAIFVAENGPVQGNQIPQHPAAPQHQMDLDLSGSPLEFLKGTGPEISLDDVIQSIQSDGSSSSSDASSPAFLAAQSHCANIALFHRKGSPGGTEQGQGASPSVTIRPILIDSNAVPTPMALPNAGNPTIGFEIVPWKPVLHVMALQLWPHIVEARKRTVPKETTSVNVLILDEGDQGPLPSGPSAFEFQTRENQPSPQSTRGKKKKQSHVPRVLSLPSVVSASSSTPLTERSVRRSTRLNSNDGFRQFRLDRDPSKKRKICAVQIDEATGQAGAIPISVLQGWGIDCGVAPCELTDEALMQTPLSPVYASHTGLSATPLSFHDE
jgi:hypothetical protein